MANTQTNSFYLKGAKRQQLRINHIEKNKIMSVLGMTLKFDGEAPVLEFEERGMPFHYHYSQVHSDLEW